MVMRVNAEFDDGFCNHEPLWDTNLTWYSGYPAFTPCFTNTVLTLVPCAWLWFFGIIYLAAIGTRNATSLGIGCLNITKTTASLLLIVAVTTRTIFTGLHYTSVSETLLKADVVCPIIRIFTLIFFIVMTQIQTRRGVVTSGVIFFFWLFELVCGVVPFYTACILKLNISDPFQFSLITIDYTLVVVLFFLVCFAEKLPASSLDQKRCPISEASIPCLLSFFWLSPLIILGYRKELVADDFWDLPEWSSSVNLGFRMRAAWQKELYRSGLTRSWITDAGRDSLVMKRPCLSGVEIPNEQNDVVISTAQTPLIAEKTRKCGSLSDSGDDDDDDDDDEDKRKGPRKVTASLVRCIIRVFAWDIFKAHTLQFFDMFIVFIFPLLLQQLIAFVESPVSDRKDQWKGYLYGVLYFATAIVQSIITEQVWYRSYITGLDIETGLCNLVYRKVLTVGHEGSAETTSGRVVNLMSVDSHRFSDIMKLLWSLWSAPLQLAIAIAFLYYVVGASVFAGLGVILIVMPLNMKIMTLYNKYEDRLMTLKDRRIKLTNEVFTGMKVLKMYAWEESFQRKIQKIRNQELRNLRSIYILISFAIFTWTLAPSLMSLVTFATYVNVNPSHYLSPSVAFTANILFGILQVSLNMFPMMIGDLARVRVSIARLSNFLSHKDLDPDNVISSYSDDAPITIENGTFQWDAIIGPILKDINLRVPRGSLVMVVGRVGCGKSSLLSAILGNMEKLSGIVTSKGSLAYVPQEAWILNATLRDNILFASEYNKDKYEKVLDACAMRPDLAVLSGADLTEIGEKGINLSGGQKQRVSLARAVYNDADIYLFDDPLSSVDAHVGKHIFEEVMSENGLLKDKTRVLVTNGIHWLPRADNIVVLSDNRVSEAGTYNELLQHNGAFAKFLRTYLADHSNDAQLPEDESVRENILMRLVSIPTDDDSDDDGDGGGAINDPVTTSPETSQQDGSLKLTVTHASHDGRSTTVDGDTNADLDGAIAQREGKMRKAGALTEEEEVASGKVKWSVYITYAQAAGLVLCTSVVVCYLLYLSVNVAANIWLQQWTDNKKLADHTIPANSSYRQHTNDVYLGIYGLFAVLQVSFIMGYGIITAFAAIRASTTLHNRLLRSVLHAPIEFFDTTPIGRLINRFTNDMDSVDEQLPELLISWIMAIFNILTNVIIITYSLPIFLSVIIPAFAIFFVIQRIYVASSRQMKRLGATSESPIYTHLSESMTGAAVIRAFREQPRFIRTCETRVNNHQVFNYAFEGASQWLSFLLSTLGNFGVLAAAMFAVSKRGSITGGIVGLAVQYALQITESLSWFVEIHSDVEGDIVAVERIKNYTDIKHEDDWKKPGHEPPPNWPNEGKIEFRDYTTRYRSDLDLVLKGISVVIKPGEKVGIVGRTGAGKSSLTLALFRIIEPNSGSILIDGIDISTLGLHDLRSRLTILPQEPVLFSGTLRFNIDPFSMYSDEELWRALDHSHLREFVESLPERLDYECGESGQGLSIGQRQLLCLARALLKKTTILVLDEATAAVDMQTDALIQDTIRTEFSGCTIIAIAHRLHTIMDYDRIMVMDGGLVAQFDTPNDLLADQDGIFHNLASNAGIV